MLFWFRPRSSCWFVFVAVSCQVNYNFRLQSCHEMGGDRWRHGSRRHVDDSGGAGCRTKSSATVRVRHKYLGCPYACEQTEADVTPRWREYLDFQTHYNAPCHLLHHHSWRQCQCMLCLVSFNVLSLRVPIGRGIWLSILTREPFQMQLERNPDIDRFMEFIPVFK